MFTFKRTVSATPHSHRRGGQAMANPLLRIEGETLSYAELGAQFGVSEQVMRIAVRKARGLKAGLTKDTLRQVIRESVHE